MRYSLPLLLSPLLLAACATPANHYDPLEPVNRKVYAFNVAVDKAVLKPVARGYVAVTPSPVRTAVSNFFGNLGDVYIGTSNFLQGKWRQGTTDFGRVIFNSTLGLGGLIDIASMAPGLPKHNEDLGQVLGFWGVGSGPYLMLPLLGPKTLRDTTDYYGIYYLSPTRHIHDSATVNSMGGLNLVERRAQLLPVEETMHAAAFGDEYAFVRDSYLQRRYSLVWDGRPPVPLQLGDKVEVDDDEIDVKSLDMSGLEKIEAPEASKKSPSAP
ncbi:MlaA family lipoprotein [Chitinimonas sp. BJB300]|uniref:MlaA family lipoprotein n=1 Tax=Chitinimonas sp. BJB300 TaxID=1559339 RepID=UPI00130432CB|nr:VacJ family lipoprotein [Chitinimonas sp. BJB300]